MTCHDDGGDDESAHGEAEQHGHEGQHHDARRPSFSRRPLLPLPLKLQPLPLLLRPARLLLLPLLFTPLLVLPGSPGRAHGEDSTGVTAEALRSQPGSAPQPPVRTDTVTRTEAPAP
jgi:hypothetical protein